MNVSHSTGRSVVENAQTMSHSVVESAKTLAGGAKDVQGKQVVETMRTAMKKMLQPFEKTGGNDNARKCANAVWGAGMTAVCVACPTVVVGVALGCLMRVVVNNANAKKSEKVSTQAEKTQSPALGESKGPQNLKQEVADVEGHIAKLRDAKIPLMKDVRKNQGAIDFINEQIDRLNSELSGLKGTEEGSSKESLDKQIRELENKMDDYNLSDTEISNLASEKAKLVEERNKIS